MPLWSAFTVSRQVRAVWSVLVVHVFSLTSSVLQTGVSIVDGNFRSDNFLPNCTRADVRLAESVNCSQYYDVTRDVAPSFLYPPGMKTHTFSYYLDSI